MRRRYRTHLLTFVSAVALCCLLEEPVAAQTVTIEQYAAEAPNVYGSPSYSGWAANAIYALENGLTSYGTPNTPTYFQEIQGVSTSGNIVTNFNSWNGVANPSSPYSKEEGNRLTFLIVAKSSSGNNISLSQLSETMSSNDAKDTFGVTYNWGTGQFCYSGHCYTYGAATYSADQVGLISGGGEYNSGQPGTDEVNELIVIGIGNALANTSGGTCSALGSTQAAINCVVAEYDALFPLVISSTAMIDGVSNTDPVNVPEPGTLALFGAALAGLGLVGMRRRKA